ncbi:MAG: OmpA family protein [Sphingobacteriales bacterium]|nr:OmpA family protein [Sphingobacteriales bacterium]
MTQNRTPWCTWALAGWMIFATFWYVCKILNLCPFNFGGNSAPIATTAPAAETTNTAVAATPASYDLTIQDDTLRVSSADNLYFRRSGANPSIPASVNGIYRRVVDYLNGSKRGITLTGVYSKDETNTTTFPNLGIARAEGVKGRLITLGLSPDRIKTEGREVDNLNFNDERLMGGIVYGFHDYIGTAAAANDAERLKTAEQALNIGPKYLYFETGENNLAFDAETEQYMQYLSYYLSQKPNETAKVTGHTDNVGVAAANLKLGQERADFVKAYMSTLGIPAEKITATSKGITQPIAPNDTPEGRQKNRRVEINIK